MYLLSNYKILPVKLNYKVKIVNTNYRIQLRINDEQ